MRNTEFGEKPNDYGIEFPVRLFLMESPPLKGGAIYFEFFNGQLVILHI